MKPNFIKSLLIGLLISQQVMMSSCQRKISASALYPDRELSQKLPFNVETNLRESSLDRSYQDFIVKKGTGSTYYTTNPFMSFFTGFANAFSDDTYLKDDRKNDTRTVIERDFANNIGLNTGTRKLIATVNIVNFAESKSINPVPAIARIGLAAATVMSEYSRSEPDPTTGKKNYINSLGLVLPALGISSTFIGIPRWRKQQATVDIEVTLSDLEGNPVSRYSARGVGNTKTGWYPWNYSKYGALHYSNIKAVTNAMNEIKSKIEMDYDKIVEAVK